MLSAAARFSLYYSVMARTYKIEVCLGSSCFSRGNRDLIKSIKDYLRKRHLEERVNFRGARCLDRCSSGPVIMIDGDIIEDVSVSNIEKILDTHLM